MVVRPLHAFPSGTVTHELVLVLFQLGQDTNSALQSRNVQLQHFDLLRLGRHGCARLGKRILEELDVFL